MEKCMKTIVFGMLVLSCILTGCKPMKVNVETEMDFESLVEELKENQPNEVSSHIVLDGTDSFCMDAEIHISKELETYSLGKLTMYRHIITDEDKEFILKTLLNEFDWGEDLLKKSNYRVKDESFENEELETALSLYVDQNLSAIVQSRGISVENGYLGEFYRGLGISVWNEIQEDPEYYKLLTVTNEELEFASIEKAKSDVTALMQKLGLDFQCESEIYTFSLEKLVDRIAQDRNFYEGSNIPYNEENAKVTKQDEAYNIVLLQGANGVPLFPYEMSPSVTNSTFVGSQCSVLYSALGIENMGLRNLYDIKAEGESQHIYSLGEILEIYYNERAKETAAKEKIIKVGLYYLPVCVDEEHLKFEAKPIWYILSDVEYGTLNDTFREWTVYDAVTGEELAC